MIIWFFLSRTVCKFEDLGTMCMLFSTPFSRVSGLSEHRCSSLNREVSFISTRVGLLEFGGDT